MQLGEIENGKFQWSLRLDRVKEQKNGIEGWIEEVPTYRQVVQNRSWHLVGPEFTTRKDGARYLGSYDGFYHRCSDLLDHLQVLANAYDALYSDAVTLHYHDTVPMKEVTIDTSVQKG